MQNTVNVSAHVLPNSGAHYSAQEIADAHSVSSTTVRTRWFKWLLKVAPADLLKGDRGYTELARALFAEFAAVDKAERSAWVSDAKQRYSAEWSSAGVLEGELMPDQVGGVLATMQVQRGDLEQAIAQQLADAQQFIGQLQQAETSFTQAELQNYRANGLQRGIQRFQIEAQAELETLHQLRKQRINGELD